MFALALVAARWVHFCAESLLFATALFALYAPGDTAGIIKRPALPIALTTLISGIAWALCSLVGMVEDPKTLLDAGTLSDFFLGTDFGRAWLFRLGFLAVLTGLAAVPWKYPLFALPTAGLSGAVLVSQAWLGHAASGAGFDGWMQILCYGAHVLAAAAWLGGLPPLLLALRRSGQKQLAILLDRFSILGMACVAAILASGIGNTVFRLDSARSLIFTVYGQIVLAKVGLLGVLLMLAAVNRFGWMTRLRTAALSFAAARERLIRNVVLEQIFGAGVLLAAAILGTLSPYE